MERAVDRGAIAVWRWRGALAAAFVVTALAVPALASPLPAAASVPVLALIAVAAALLAAWHPAARYRHLAYKVDDTGIMIRDGVFWRTQSALARLRIQHTDVTQGPLQRHYGVATLKLYTAGSHYTKIELPGLAHDAAIALRDELQRKGDGDAI